MEGTHVEVNGHSVWVLDSGPQPGNKGTVLLFHGFPDTSEMWQPQIKALNEAGYRTIAPDLLGLGKSAKPTDLAAYDFQSSVPPTMLALVDALSLDKFSVVGHDFGAGVAWGLVFASAVRVCRHGTYFTAQPFEQRAASWYIPFYFMPGAEEALTANDWKFFRELLGVNASQRQMDAYVERLLQLGAFSTALSLYRGNFSAQLFANSTPIPPPVKLPMPVLAVHPTGDTWCLEGQMLASKIAVEDSAWQYKQVDGGHWFFVQEPGVLNKLLLDFLGQPSAKPCGCCREGTGHGDLCYVRPAHCLWASTELGQH